MKCPTRQRKLPIAINPCHLFEEKIRCRYRYQTHAAAPPEFLHRGISLCHTVPHPGVCPWPGGWRRWRKTFFAHLVVCQNSCSGCQHSPPSRLACSAGVGNTQSHQLLEKNNFKYEWEWGSQRQQILGFCHNIEAHAGNPWHWVCLLEPRCRHLPQGWENNHVGTPALAWSSTQGKHGNRFREFPNTE